MSSVWADQFKIVIKSSANLLHNDCRCSRRSTQSVLISGFFCRFLFLQLLINSWLTGNYKGHYIAFTHHIGHIALVMMNTKVSHHNLHIIKYMMRKIVNPGLYKNDCLFTSLTISLVTTYLHCLTYDLYIKYTTEFYLYKVWQLKNGTGLKILSYFYRFYLFVKK